MKNLIACCGLNCGQCEARIATLNNDDDLRKYAAEVWSKQFETTIPFETINCTGCREEGVKMGHCASCQVRNCVQTKGYNTCADCSELDTCKIVAQVHQYSQVALSNLKSLQN
ncbi:MAG: DUF3795 domain-containing protein [Paludibacter sp.]|nr:DUF3795 domain-containing protein [Paludibacter sp.]